MHWSEAVAKSIDLVGSSLSVLSNRRVGGHWTEMMIVVGHGFRF